MHHGKKTMVSVADAAQLCVEVIGDHDDPALLLIGGATWSMDWWEDGLCRKFAERGLCVIRYDPRDTGESASYPPGAPGYTTADQVTDAIAVLDALGFERAHVVGLSMGGGIAQRLALQYRTRVMSLTLISTSSVDPKVEYLSDMSPEVEALFADGGPPEPDWQDRDAVIDHVVESERPFAGPGNFDEPRLRAVAGRVFDRTRDMAASLQNHFLLGDPGEGDLDLRQLDGLPTLVLHGTADPLIAPGNGRALADAIPGARLMELDGVGHQLPPPTMWDRVVEAVTDVTQRGERPGERAGRR